MRSSVFDLIAGVGSKPRPEEPALNNLIRNSLLEKPDSMRNLAFRRSHPLADDLHGGNVQKQCKRRNLPVIEPSAR
jgi:hypothetical protein